MKRQICSVTRPRRAMTSTKDSINGYYEDTTAINSTAHVIDRGFGVTGEHYVVYRAHKPHVLNLQKGKLRSPLVVVDGDTNMHYGSVTVLLDNWSVGVGGKMEYATLDGMVTNIPLDLRAVRHGKHKLTVIDGKKSKATYLVTYSPVRSAK